MAALGIGEVSALTGLTTHTLRFYEQISPPDRAARSGMRPQATADLLAREGDRRGLGDIAEVRPAAP